MEEGKTTALTRRAHAIIEEVPGGASHPIARIDRNGLTRVALEIDRFCQDLTRAGRVRPSTVETYQKRLRYFLGWLETLPIEPPWAWSLELMYAYRAHLEQTLRSPRAMNGYVVALRQFGSSLKTLYQRPMDPAEFVKGWKTIRSPQQRPLPVADAKTPQEGLARAEAFITEWAQHPLITPAVAPHALYTLDAATLKAARALSLRHNVPMLIHMAETEAETAVQMPGADSNSQLTREELMFELRMSTD